jgi:hypothetical protein
MQSGKYSNKGSVTVQSFQNRLRLRLPRQLFNGQQKFLTLGLDMQVTKEIYLFLSFN